MFSHPKVKGQVLVEASVDQMERLRTSVTDDEVVVINSLSRECDAADAGCTVAWFDDRPFHREGGLYGLWLVAFALVVLAAGSWFLVTLANKLVVAPIERMFKVIEMVALSLNSLKYDHKVRPSRLSSSSLQELRWSSSSSCLREISFVLMTAL